jgi:hypothetical protein
MYQTPRSPYRRRLCAPCLVRCSMLTAIGSLLLGAFCGCGAGAYEQRLNNRLAREQKAARFNVLYAPQVLEGLPVSVRIPTAFTKPPMIEGRGQVDVRRVKPGVVTLPALKLTYEMTIKDEKGGQSPYYCYVGAMKAAENQLQEVCNTLRGALTAKPGGDVSDWVDFQGEAPDGHEVTWKKLRCVSQQEFVGADAAGQPKIETTPGVLEIYLHEEKGYVIAIAWRMPKSIEANVDLAQWAPLVAGCASVTK